MFVMTGQRKQRLCSDNFGVRTLVRVQRAHFAGKQSPQVLPIVIGCLIK